MIITEILSNCLSLSFKNRSITRMGGLFTIQNFPAGTREGGGRVNKAKDDALGGSQKCVKSDLTYLCNMSILNLLAHTRK